MLRQDQCSLLQRADGRSDMLHALSHTKFSKAKKQNAENLGRNRHRGNCVVTCMCLSFLAVVIRIQRL